MTLWNILTSVKLFKMSIWLVSSVAHWCLTLHGSMECIMPGFPVHHQLLELAQIHVHGVCDATQPSHPLSSPSPPAFNLSLHQGLYQWASHDSSVSKESTCNAGDPGLIPESRRSAGEGISFRIQYPLQYPIPTPVSLGFLGGSAGKESAYNVGDLCLIPGLRRSPVEGKGYPFQYSGLGEFHDCIVRDSLESSAKPQFKTINSLVLSFLWSSTLTSIHDYWKNHSFD